MAYSVVAIIENGFSALVAIFAGWLADKIGLTEAMADVEVRAAVLPGQP